MEILLCMPTTNVDVECIFADLSNIKTKTRNKLHSTTVSSLLECKQAIKLSSGPVSSLSHHLKSNRECILYDQKGHQEESAGERS